MAGADPMDGALTLRLAPGTPLLSVGVVLSKNGRDSPCGIFFTTRALDDVGAPSGVPLARREAEILLGSILHEVVSLDV